MKNATCGERELQIWGGEVEDNEPKWEFSRCCVVNVYQRRQVNVTDVPTLNNDRREDNNQWSWLFADTQSCMMTQLLYWDGTNEELAWRDVSEEVRLLGKSFKCVSAQHSSDRTELHQRKSFLKVVCLLSGRQTWWNLSSDFLRYDVIISASSDLNIESDHWEIFLLGSYWGGNTDSFSLHLHAAHSYYLLILDRHLRPGHLSASGGAGSWGHPAGCSESNGG